MKDLRGFINSLNLTYSERVKKKHHPVQFIKHKSPPATEGEILKIEKEMGLALPDDYKDFLRIADGGFIELTYQFELAEEVPKGFGMDNSTSILGDFSGIAGRFTDNTAPFFEGYLIIGEDNSFDDCILLELSTGKIYYWCEAVEPVDDEYQIANETMSPEARFLVANSFNEFLEKLTIYKDPED